MTAEQSLAETIAARLRSAGLAYDPALWRIREWNATAALAAELDPERAGFRSHWKRADLRRLACR